MTDPGLAVEPLNLNGYLESRGWQRDGTYRGANVWSLGPSGRLLIPERLEYDDDSDLIVEAVRQLAAYEERPERDVIRDIAEPMVDAQYYRLFPDAPAGMISLPSGVRAIQGVHDLLGAAARAVHEGPRLHFEGRRAAPVENFLHQVMLGTAMPGSYILTARVPVDAVRQQVLDLGETLKTSMGRLDLPAREVVSRLHEAVHAAQGAAQRVIQDGRVDGFYDGVEQGLSANLCRALADLGGSRRNHPFEVGFTWAYGLPQQQTGGAISFSGTMAAVLTNAAQELEQLARTGQARITGYVENLYSRPGEQRRIKIVGDLQDQAGMRLARRSLWVTVTEDQYDQAFEAQRRGWSLDIEGQLGTAQRRLEMRPSRFDVRRAH